MESEYSIFAKMKCLLYIYYVYILVVNLIFVCFGVILLLSYCYLTVILRHDQLADSGILRDGKYEPRGDPSTPQVLNKVKNVLKFIIFCKKVVPTIA